MFLSPSQALRNSAEKKQKYNEFVAQFIFSEIDIKMIFYFAGHTKELKQSHPGRVGLHEPRCVDIYLSTTYSCVEKVPVRSVINNYILAYFQLLENLTGTLKETSVKS